MATYFNETESIPFPIKESMFSSREEAIKVKARLGLKSVNEALSYADSNGWLHNIVRISAICPGCGIFMLYEKYGTRYEGCCNNCRRKFYETFPTADMFLEYVYGEFYRTAMAKDKLTKDGQMRPCICGNNRLQVYSNGGGKWNVRCIECGRSLHNYAPRAEYAIAAWNQLALDCINISDCPTCGVHSDVYTDVLPSGSFRCRCSKCGMVGIEGNTKSEAWRLWNREIDSQAVASDMKPCISEAVANGDGIRGDDRVATLEAENAYLKDMLARFIGIALGVRDANEPLVASLESIHKAMLALSASLKVIPFEEMKNPPEGLKDFMNNALEGKGTT